MRIALAAALVVALALPGCSKGMLKASEVKPAVDLIVKGYKKLIDEHEADSANAQLRKDTADDLKATVDKAAAQ